MHRARSGVPVAARPAARADRGVGGPEGPSGCRLTRRIVALGAIALLALTAPAGAELSAVEVEEASETGRRAAAALLRGQRPAFEQAIAADAIAAGFLGAEVWQGLSERQRELVRSAIRRRFSESLEPPRSGRAEVAWSSARARPDAEGVLLDLGLRYPSGLLKTRWMLERSGRGWGARDVFLADPGVSLAEEARRAFGPRPVERRDRAREALSAAAPRAVGIAAALAVVLVFGRRLSPSGRTILRLTAAAPIVLFAVDGVLAARRAVSEEYVLRETLPPAPWRAAEREALLAQSAGRLEDARRAWARAAAAGAPPAPSAYRFGVALRGAGRFAEAREHFFRALAARPPAPGAERELGMMLIAEGNHAEARRRLERYLATAGPDPDTLSALAIARANTGDEKGAVALIEEARALVADRSRSLLLEAQVHARAGDATKTVAALRAIEAETGIDREALRSDPVYLPIATDPVWVKFLAEMTK